MKSALRFLAQNMPVLQQLGITPSVLTAGIFLVGATGSGKTSSIRILMRAIIECFLSGVVHCAVKPDEAQNAEAIVAGTIMQDRCLRLTPGNFTFNFVRWELEREGGAPGTLARLFMRLNEILNRARGDHEQSFWKNLYFDFLLFASIVAHFAYRDEVNVEHILECILGSPASVQELLTANYEQSNKTYLMLKRAEANLHNKEEAELLRQASEFFQKRVPRLGDKARTAGVQQCSSLLGPFTRSPFRQSFCCSDSTWTPDAPLNQYYTIVDAPVLVYQEAGRLMNNVIVQLTMEAALRRRNPHTYVTILRDEYQALCDPQFDVLAQSLARSQKLCCISAVQNLPLLQATFAGSNAEQEMRGLLGNFATKFVLQNICDSTNRYFSELFGRRKQLFSSFSEKHSEQAEGLESAIWGHAGVHHSQSEQLDYNLPPQAFLDLRRGGPDHDYQIDCYQTSSGVIYPETGQSFRGITFSQR